MIDREDLKEEIPRLRERIAELESAAPSIESQERYQDLYDNAPDMFCSVAADTGLIVECNNTLANALGYSKDEILHLHVSELYHPASEQALKNNLEP